MDTAKDNSKLLLRALKEPGLKYAPDNQLSLFPEKELLKGEIFDSNHIKASPDPTHFL